MCNLYRQTTAADAMRTLFAPIPLAIRAGNLEPGRVYPDQAAPIIRRDGDGLVLDRARWGLPSPPQYHTKSGIDRGVTNVRNTASPHWRRWLGPDNRCLVPVDRFNEGPWFAPTDPDTVMLFAGIHVPNWTSVRKLKDGQTTDDLFAFLTTAPNADVAAAHPKAMPVILTRPDEWHLWLTANWADARALQRPLPDGALRVVEDAGA